MSVRVLDSQFGLNAITREKTFSKLITAQQWPKEKVGALPSRVRQPFLHVGPRHIVGHPSIIAGAALEQSCSHHVCPSRAKKMENLMRNENRRETGGRVLKKDPSYQRPHPLDTGDRGDKPKKPYGLTRELDQTQEKGRTTDGRPSKRDAGKSETAGRLLV